MYQYDDPSAVSSLPVPAAAGTPGFFSDGNPSAGAQATILRSDFMNMLMMELINLVTGAGLTLSKTNYTQVRSAIQLMIATGQQAVIFTGVAFAAGVANGNAVKWNAGANNYALAQADGTSDDLAVGFADVTNGRVFFKGLVPGLFVGLTPGTRYYLSPTTAGAITSIRPTDAVSVGIAENANTIFADFVIAPTGQLVTGQVITVAGNTPLAGTVALQGALLSRTTYANLWTYAQASGNIAASDAAWVEGQFSPGDGATTFRTPDFRGNFPRFWDNGRGIDSGRAIGSLQLDAMQGHLHSSGTASPTGVSGNAGVTVAAGSTGSPISDGTNGTPRTAIETRPRNVSMLACIAF